MSGPVYLHKVADCALTCISVHGNPVAGGGRMVAVGDVTGCVTLLEVSDNLCTPQPNEKLLLGAFFERESKREENLEKRALALARAAKAAKSAASGEAAQAAPGDEVDAAVADTLKKIDVEFEGLVRGAEEGEAVAAGEAALAADHHDAESKAKEASE